MHDHSGKNKQSKKIVSYFILLLLGFILFLSVVLYRVSDERRLPNPYTSDSTRAMRGSIISADGFHLAAPEKRYKAIVDVRCIDPDKRELFVRLFAIYSGIPAKTIEKRLKGADGSVVLSFGLSNKGAEYLKTLAFELRRLDVFREYELPSGRTIMHGLDIQESGETRHYPYRDLLTPLIGHTRKTEVEGYTRTPGRNGLEKAFDEWLKPRQNGYAFAPRDINNYKLLTKQSRYRPPIDGYDLYLTIPVTLQIRIEKVLDAMKEQLDADEVMAIVMQSGDGKILSLASSNRYTPSHILRRDYPALNIGAVTYGFEPGSVIKPLVFSLLLEQKRISPLDLVNTHGGRYKIGRTTITDEHAYDWLTAEDVIVHSSNVGMAQLAQQLSAIEIHEGLTRFGFTRDTGVGLPYEKRGSLPYIRRLNAPIYKATASYGYGLQATPLQLLKAYNVFNNGGVSVTPTLVSALRAPDGSGDAILPLPEPQQVISPATAEKMKKILVKTVRKGTGQKTITPGLEIGGKTGTAHIARHGGYVDQYNTSFMGFANDALGRRYTIGVTVVQPKTYHFASQTAAPVFKNVVDVMVKEGYLTPAAPKPAAE